MAQDILLIGRFGEFQVLFFFDQIKEATKDNPSEELIFRLNSEGGNPDFSQTIIQKTQELGDQVTIKATAMAHSTALFLMAYIPAERCECTDTTQAVLHRAAWPKWIEESEGFAGSTYETTLLKTNKDLEKAFRARVNVDALEALPQMKERNLKLKDIFSMEARNEVVLTGADLKKIGLVSKVEKLTPTKTAELRAQFEIFRGCESIGDYRVAASASKDLIDKPKVDEHKTENIMTLAELKEKHPAIYAEAIAAGKKDATTEAVEAERERIQAWSEFAEVDAEGVKAGIASGKPISMAQVVAYMKKMNEGKGASEQLGKIEKDSAGKIITPETTAEKTEKEKQSAAFLAEVNTSLGLKKTA